VAFDQSGPRWLGISDLIAEPEGPTFISYKVARSRLDRLRFVTQDPIRSACLKPAKKRRRLAGCADAQSSDFVAPPRTIADIIAILDQEKPDPERIAKMQTGAEAQPSPPISNTVATIKAIA